MAGEMYFWIFDEQRVFGRRWGSKKWWRMIRRLMLMLMRWCVLEHYHYIGRWNGWRDDEVDQRINKLILCFILYGSIGLDAGSKLWTFITKTGRVCSFIGYMMCLMNSNRYKCFFCPSMDVFIGEETLLSDGGANRGELIVDISDRHPESDFWAEFYQFSRSRRSM